MAFANDILCEPINTGCVLVKSSPPCPSSSHCLVQNCSGNFNAWISSVSNRLNSVSRQRRSSNDCSNSVMQSGVSGTIKLCKRQRNYRENPDETLCVQKEERTRDRHSKNTLSSLQKHCLHGLQRWSSCIARCVTHRTLRCCKSLSFGIC